MGEVWPGVKQVCRIQRVVRRKDRKTGTWKITSEVDYAITSLERGRASAQDLLKRWRVHWHIENRLHWVRDVTFGEDASQMHRGQAPEVFATLRNAAISLLKQFGFSSVAIGTRELQMGPAGVLRHFAKLSHALRARGQDGAGQLPKDAQRWTAVTSPQLDVMSVRARAAPLVK